MEESRREFLKASAGLASVGVVASTAGCSQVPIIGGGGNGNAYYKNWMYAPDTFADEQEHYGFTAYRPSNVESNEDRFDENTYDATESIVERRLEGTGVDFEDINQFVSLGNGTATVAKGSFNTEDVRSELEDTDGFEEDTETDNGYTIFLNGSQGVAVGVNSTAIVRVNNAPSGGRDGGSDLATGPRPSMPVQDDVRSISYGETVRGRISESDPERSEYYGYYEPITFSGGAGEEIQITMRSEDDPRIMLLDPDGRVVAENDDANIEGTYNSQVNHSLSSSGEYTIIATSFSEYATFEYSLELRVVYSPDVLVDAVETISLTQSGDTSLYGSEVDAANTLFDRLGGGDMVSGRTMEAVEEGNPEAGRFENMTGRGTSVTVNGDTSNLRAVVVYEDADDFDDGDIEDWTDEAQQFDDVDNISINQNGNTAVVSGTIDTDDIGN